VVKRSDRKEGGFEALATNNVPSFEDGTAELGRTYFYRVQVRNSAGESQDSDVVEVRPLAGPSTLSAEGSQGSIRLSWSPLEGARDYTLVRAETAGGPFTAIATGVLGLGYEDRAVEIGKRYFYRVQAQKSPGVYSGFSGLVMAQTAPPAPHPLEVELFAGGTVRLRWTALSGVADEFVVESSADGVGYSELARVEGTQRSAVLGGLGNGTVRFFRMHAANASGRSTDSVVRRIEFPTWAANVVFAPEAGAKLLPGYVLDSGKPFGATAEGSKLGWRVDQSERVAKRSALFAPDVRYQGSILVEKSAVWELEVPWGSYRVRLVVGDAETPQATHQFLLEGLPTSEVETGMEAPWAEIEMKLFVQDGRLTLAPGPASIHSRLCFIDVFAEAPSLPSVVEQPVSQKLVEEEALVLESSVSGGTEPISWQWFFNLKPLAGARSARLELPSIQPSQSGAYFVVASNDFGAVTSRVAVVEVEAVEDPPTLDIVPSFQIVSGLSSSVVKLTGISSGAADERQTLSLTLSNWNPGLLSRADLNYRSPETMGEVELSANTGVTGTVVLTVMVSDGKAEVARTFTVSIARKAEDALQIEAESGERNAVFEVIGEAGASGGRIVRPSADGFGRLAFPFFLDRGGDYFVWCRLMSEESLGVSFRAAVDREPVDTEETGLGAARPNVWRWVRLSKLVNGDPKVLSLTRGPHQLVFQAPKAKARLDTLYVTDDPLFLPPGVQANFPPTLNPLEDLVLEEGAPAQVVALSGIGSEGVSERQNLIVTAVSGDPRSIPNPNISYSSPSANGTLTFTPSHTAFGSVPITVTVNDGGGVNNVARRTFLVTLQPRNQPPRLGSIPNQTVVKGRGFPPLTWVIGDRESAADQLAVRAFSSNPALLPQAMISVTGSGSNRVVQLAPIPNVAGSTSVTLEVTDGNGSVSTTRFNASVTENRMPPTISRLPDFELEEDAALGPLTFVVADPDSPVEGLVVTATAADARLLPASGLILGGEGVERTLMVIPAKDALGTTKVTLAVRDDSGMQASSTFSVVVLPLNDPPQMSAVGDRTLTLHSPSNTVFLTGVSAGPGEDQPLMIRAVSERPDLIPNPRIVMAGGDARSASLVLGPFLRVAERVPIRVTLDDGKPVRNTFTRVFHVTVSAPSSDAAPTLSAIPDQTVVEDGTLAVPFTVSDETLSAHQLRLTLSSSLASLLPESTVEFQGVGTNRLLILRPRAQQSGVALLTIFASDGRLSGRTSFKLTVTPVNDPSAMDPIGDLVVDAADPSLTHSVTISGLSSGPVNESGTLTVKVASSRTDLIPHPEVRYVSGSEFANVLLRPAAGKSGSARITMEVRELADAASVTVREFKVYVRAAGNKDPEVSFLEDVTLLQNFESGIIRFRVNDAETASANLEISASTSNPELLPESGIVLGGSGTNRTLTLRPARDRTGFTMITLSVADQQGGVGSSSFFVIVDPANQPPRIEGLSPQTVPAQDPRFELEFTAWDLETSPEMIELSVTSSDEALFPPEGLSLASVGRFRLLTARGNAGRSGRATLKIVASDGALKTEGTVEVSVHANPGPPSLGLLSDVILEDGKVFEEIPLDLSDPDTPLGQLIVTVKTSNPAVVPETGLSVAHEFSKWKLRVSPAAGVSGRSVIGVEVSDGIHKVQQSFEVRVMGENRPPTLDKIGDITLAQDGLPRTIVLTGISPGKGESGQPLLISASSSDPAVIPHPLVGAVDASGAAMLTVASVAGSRGVVTIRVILNDLQPKQATTVREFKVTFNAAPSISALDAVAVPEGGVSKPIEFTLSDEDDELAKVSLSARSSHPGVVDPAGVLMEGTGATRSVRVRPVAGAFGSSVVTLVARDAAGNEATSSLVVVVDPVENPPTLGALPDLEIAAADRWVPIRIGGISTGSPFERGVLEVVAVSLAPGIIPDPLLAYTSPEAEGMLYLAPWPGRFGTAEIRVSVLEYGSGAGRTSRTFRVTRLEPERIPELRAEWAEEGLILTWSSDRTAAYVLQRSDDLGNPGNWKEVGVAAALQDGLYRVVMPVDGARFFFRLCKECSR